MVCWRGRKARERGGRAASHTRQAAAARHRAGEGVETRGRSQGVGQDLTDSAYCSARGWKWQGELKAARTSAELARRGAHACESVISVQALRMCGVTESVCYVKEA